MRKKSSKLKVYRALLGVTQESLSERSNVSTVTISLLEAGKRSPRTKTQNRLSHALGVEADRLFPDDADA